MKSTSKKNNLFSLEDFEKGLMLAGYISPNNSNELVEREILNDYENQKDEKRKSSYFKRAVLAAEITYQLHAESTFGHVKLQKLMFLCEHASNMDLNDLYLKKAAGPFDNKFMHSIDKELAKQKWFTAKRKKSGGFTRIVYEPLENPEGYKKYFTGYFKKSNKAIQFLIETFKRERTRKVELVATIFACWIELNEKQMELNQANLFKLFYSWAEEKQKFTNEEVLNTLEWMKAQKITPNTL